MNETEAARLAAATNALRPDWPLRSLKTFISGNLGARAYADAAVALAYVAVDPKSETPRRVLEAGPWWKATMTEAGTYRPPRKDEECRTHLGNYADACRGCAADQLAGDRTTPGDPRRPDRTGQVAELRRIHGVVKSQTCRHGVDRTRAKCTQCDRKPVPAATEGEPA